MMLVMIFVKKVSRVRVTLIVRRIVYLLGIMMEAKMAATGVARMAATATVAKMGAMMARMVAMTVRMMAMTVRMVVMTVAVITAIEVITTVIIIHQVD